MRPTYARPFRNTVLAVLAIALGGCATIFNPVLQPVPIDSAPPGAAVYLDGEFVGTTPITLELERGTDRELLLRLGDRERTVTLASGIDAAYMAVDLAPGLITTGVAILILATTPEPTPAKPGYWLPDLSPYILTGIGIGGIVVGLGSAGFSAAVDASTGRWYRLTPTAVLVVFD